MVYGMSGIEDGQNMLANETDKEVVYFERIVV